MGWSKQNKTKRREPESINNQKQHYLFFFCTILNNLKESNRIIKINKLLITLKLILNSRSRSISSLIVHRKPPDGTCSVLYFFGFSLFFSFFSPYLELEKNVFNKWSKYVLLCKISHFMINRLALKFF